MSTTAIILSGGTGSRFNASLPKQFLKIGKKTLLTICLQRFQDHAGIASIILVCPGEHLARAQRDAAVFPKVALVLPGGATRQESSAIGVSVVPAGARNVLIHDAARALVPVAVIDRVLAALASAHAVMPVLPVGDTTVRIDESGAVAAVLDRNVLRRVQTPQGFRTDIIKEAHKIAKNEGFIDAPDDCSLVLKYGLSPVVTVDGDPRNIKITYSYDLDIARALL